MNKKLNLNFFNRKSILITGGTGSLGNELVNFFLSKKNKIKKTNNI